MKMTRREFTKKSLFGGLFLGTGAGLTLPEMLAQSNEHIEQHEGVISPRSRKPGAICMAYGPIAGSADFPLREKGKNPRGLVAADGARIYFVWPSQRGDARGYIMHEGDEVMHDDQIVFRLMQGRPTPPYYLRWRRGEYYLYTHPGTLVKRAYYYIAQNDDQDAVLQAVSDLRMAVLLNLSHTGEGQDVLDELADLDSHIRTVEDIEVSMFDDYRRLLTQTNPANHV